MAKHLSSVLLHLYLVFLGKNSSNGRFLNTFITSYAAWLFYEPVSIEKHVQGRLQ